MSLLAQAGVFTATGILSTIVAQVLLYAGAGDSWTVLLPLSNYGGMMLAAFVPDHWTGVITNNSSVNGNSDGASGDDRLCVGDASKGRPRVGGSSAERLMNWLLFDSPRGSSSNNNNSSSGGGASNDSNMVCEPGTITVPVPVYVVCAIVLDILGFWFHIQGIKFAGSALFQVIYASVTVFAALGSWAAHTPTGAHVLVSFGLARYLRDPPISVTSASSSSYNSTSSSSSSGSHDLNALQGVGITIVLGGLAVAALAEGPARGHDHPVTASGTAGGVAALSAAAAAARSSDIVYGLACSVACAVCYGVVYTLAELLMSQPSPPRAQAVASRVGVGICVVLGTYGLVAVVPRANEVVAHIREAGLLSLQGVAIGYSLMIFSAVAHSITYFQLLGSAGAVATGIMQAARAVGVFIVSAALFCNAGPITPANAHLTPMLHESQCFTLARGISALLVCGGILLFSIGKAAKKTAHTHTNYKEPTKEVNIK